MIPGKIYSFLRFMWYEKNNLVVRRWILDFSKSIYDEIDIIPWILCLMICCLAIGSIYDQMTRVGWPQTARSAKFFKTQMTSLKKNLKKYFFFVKQRSPFKFFWVFIVKKRSPLKMHMCQPNAVFCTNIYFIFSIQTFCVEEEEDRLWVE